jgi:hypothetical protein
MRSTPNSVKNPATPSGTYKGVDAVIESLRLTLASDLSWLQKSFHRAYRSVRRDESENAGILPEREHVYYQVWQGANVDLLNVVMNDNLNAYSFFTVENPESPIDYLDDYNNKYQRNINLILWVDLSKVDNSRDIVFTENLKQEVIKVIEKAVLPQYGSTTIIDIFDSDASFTDIMGDVTVDYAESQLFNYPNHGYRFQIESTYQRDCTI